MNEEKAKFILSAYRPCHGDREDAEFVEALALVDSDPELKTWFEEQIAFDRGCAEALSKVPVPGGLREKILAGGRVSGVENRGLVRGVFSSPLSSPRILAMAAAIAAGLFVAVAVLPRGGNDASRSDWQVAALSTLTDLYAFRDRLDVKTKDHEAIRAWLAEHEPDLAGSNAARVAVAGAVGCKEVISADGVVTIVCFEYNGTMFHLASYRLPEGERGGMPPEPVLGQEGRWLAATWENGPYAYMLVAADEDMDREGILKVIEELNA